MDRITETLNTSHVSDFFENNKGERNNKKTDAVDIVVFVYNNYLNFFNKVGAKVYVDTKTNVFQEENFDLQVQFIAAFANFIQEKIRKNYLTSDDGSIMINIEEDIFTEVPIISDTIIYNPPDPALIVKRVCVEIEKFYPELCSNFEVKKSLKRKIPDPPNTQRYSANPKTKNDEQFSAILLREISPLRERITALENDDHLRSALKTTNEHLEEVTKKHTKAIVDAGTLHLQNNQQAISQALGESVEGVKKQLEEQANTMLDSKKREIVETIILEDAMQLWEGKAKAHKRYFAIGAAVFVSAVLIPVIYLLTHWPETVDAVKALTPSGNSFALGNLVVVTIPVLGYAWILRLISRFTLQNMMLSDDASQRSVMAKTFIRLVGHGQADENHDRAIMLNALFRPLPGAGEPDIQPPNLTDFLKGKT